MEISSIALFTLWVVRALMTADGKLSIIIPPFIVPLAMLLFLSLVQIVPLPLPVLKVLSPGTYRVYSDTLQAGSGPWVTLSLYPEAGLSEIMRFVSYLCVYFLIVQILRTEDEIAAMTGTVVMIGALISLLGIFQFMSWNGKLLWFRQLGSVTAFGPYINRNHFAGLMEMIIPVGVGASLVLAPSTKGFGGMREFVSDFFIGSRSNRLILVSAGTVLMITALFLSLSRGGIMGFSLSMVFLGIMLSLRTSTKRKGRVIVGFFLVIIFTVGWFGWKPVMGRLETIKSPRVTYEDRLKTWKESLEIVKSFPVFGTGLGTFEYVYPRYKSGPSQLRWEHAHNDYVEGAVELGIPGLLTALYGVGLFYRGMFRLLKSRKSIEPRLLGLGGMAGITAILIHSVVDFNLQIGANGLFFFFLLGFTVAVAHLRIRQETREALLERKEIEVRHRSRKLMTACFVITFVALAAFLVLNAGAELFYALAGGPLGGKPEELKSRKDLLERAHRMSPLDSRYLFALGNIDAALGEKKEALKYYQSAARLHPVNGDYIQMIGVAYDLSGERESARKYMKLGVLYDPTSAWKHKNYALWLLSSGDKDTGISEMRQAIALDPGNTRNYITALVLSGLPSNETRAVIPEIPEALIIYGRYREDVGDVDGALQAYLDAATAAKQEGINSAAAYSRVAVIYRNRGSDETAIQFFIEAIKASPNDADLRVSLARLYDKLGIVYRAREEYERALLLSPSNPEANRRLKELKEK